MALTKIGSIGINTGIAFAGVTTIATLNASDNVLSVGGTVNFVSDVSIGGTVSIAGTLTYEDVTNVDAVGLITARDGIVVGSGITLSKDGDGFYTGVVTATTFSGAFSGDGSNLTGVANTDVIFTDKITLPDSSAGSINVGLGSDLQIYHTGSNSYIANTGTFRIGCTGSTNLKFFTSNSTRWNIDSDGHFVPDTDSQVDLGTNSVRVRNIYGDTLYGDGSNLTGIEAGIQTSVPKSVSGITTVLDLSKDDFKITAAGITTIDVRGGSEGNSHTLRIHNSGITTVGFSTYFLFPSGAAPIIPTADGTISLISFTVDRQGAVGLATQLLAGSSVNFS
jgi:hypothetical protein